METWLASAVSWQRSIPMCPSTTDLGFHLSPPDLKSLREIFKELEFNKLLKELSEEKASPSARRDYRLITDRMTSSPYWKT